MYRWRLARNGLSGTVKCGAWHYVLVQVQCCFTSTENVTPAMTSRFNVALRPQRLYGMLGTGSPERPPRPSHSSWPLKAWRLHAPCLVLFLGRGQQAALVRCSVRETVRATRAGRDTCRCVHAVTTPRSVTTAAVSRGTQPCNKQNSTVSTPLRWTLKSKKINQQNELERSTDLERREYCSRAENSA